MEEPDWIDEIKKFHFVVCSLATLHEPASYKRCLADAVAEGVRAKVAWIVSKAEEERRKANSPC